MLAALGDVEATLGREVRQHWEGRKYHQIFVLA